MSNLCNMSLFDENIDQRSISYAWIARHIVDARDALRYRYDEHIFSNGIRISENENIINISSYGIDIIDASDMPGDIHIKCTCLTLSNCTGDMKWVKNIECKGISFTNCDIYNLDNIHDKVESIVITDCNKLTSVMCEDHVLNIDISNCHNLIDLNGISGKIKKFRSDSCNNLRDISGLPSVMDSLTISDCNQITDLGRIAQVGSIDIRKSKGLIGCKLPVEWKLFVDYDSNVKFNTPYMYEDLYSPVYYEKDGKYDKISLNKFQI